ncbi:MAG: HAD family hydrolase [Thermodesulfobacteriota bacterium]
MGHIAAIGFDLFDTLVVLDPQTLHQAMGILIQSLRQSGLRIEEEQFQRAYREAARRFLERARLSGIETHNRFWIRDALRSLGEDVSEEDPRIGRGVEAYFSAFYSNCRLIPGTLEMLETLKARYRLGLLSNLTHAPAGWEILGRLGLRRLFDVVLISGELGYRKPHPLAFERLVASLGVDRKEMLYVGDDPDSDVNGAMKAGIRPVWSTYTRDHDVRFVVGLVSGDGHLPGAMVPRISAWADLFRLLQGGVGLNE